MLRVKTIANKWLEGSNSDFTGNAPSDNSDRTPSQIHEAGNVDKPENLSLEKDQQNVKELHSVLVMRMSLSCGPNTSIQKWV